jgi:tripartite-type tricarboxylate transporter receptor subunit TctC
LKKIIFCMSFLVSLLAGIFNAGSQEYFKGKSIRLLIGTSTGGAMEAMRRVAKVLLSSGDLGRPFIAPPEMPPDRVKILREAFSKTMNDPNLIAEINKRKWDLDPTRGDELEAISKEVMVQPPEVIERVKKVLGN